MEIQHIPKGRHITQCRANRVKDRKQLLIFCLCLWIVISSSQHLTLYQIHIKTDEKSSIQGVNTHF